MIYRMASDLEGRLHLRKFPVRVHYGPERLTRDICRSPSILIRRDREGGDKVRPAVGANSNPRLLGVRDLGVIADIYAAAGMSGARLNEHEHLCDQIVDAFLCVLYEWGAASKAGAIAISEARYLTDAEREAEEVSPGLVYRLRFGVPRAISVRDYEGSALPTAAFASTSTTTRVTVDGTKFEEL